MAPIWKIAKWLLQNDQMVLAKLKEKNVSPEKVDEVFKQIKNCPAANVNVEKFTQIIENYDSCVLCFKDVDAEMYKILRRPDIKAFVISRTRVLFEKK